MSLENDVVYEARDRVSVLEAAKQELRSNVMQIAVTHYTTAEAAAALVLSLKHQRARQVIVQSKMDLDSWQPMMVLAAVSKCNRLLFMYSATEALLTEVGLMHDGKLVSFENSLGGALTRVTEILEKTHDIPGAEDIVLAGTITKTADDIVIPDEGV